MTVRPNVIDVKSYWGVIEMKRIGLICATLLASISLSGCNNLASQYSHKASSSSSTKVVKHHRSHKKANHKKQDSSSNATSTKDEKHSSSDVKHSSSDVKHSSNDTSDTPAKGPKTNSNSPKGNGGHQSEANSGNTASKQQSAPQNNANAGQPSSNGGSQQQYVVTYRRVGGPTTPAYNGDVDASDQDATDQLNGFGTGPEYTPRQEDHWANIQTDNN